MKIVGRYLIALSLLVLAKGASAEVFCVDTPINLQNALVLAAANNQSDDVRIVQGNYIGNFIYESTEPHDLSLMGGYESGCTNPAIDPTLTVLDGNLIGTVIEIKAPSVAASFKLEYLTLKNGKFGGLFANTSENGQVLIQNSKVSNNVKSANTSWGGGVYINTGTATVSSNEISNNSSQSNMNADNGGGVYIKAKAVGFNDNIIFDNFSLSGWSYRYGGGAYINTTSATLSNNLIYNNNSTNGGGLFLLSNVAKLINNTIVGNIAETGGGLIIQYQGAQATYLASLIPTHT